MRFPVITFLVGIAGLTGGVFIGLMQSSPLLSELKKQIWVNTANEMDTLTLRGTIQDVNAEGKYFTAKIASPYSPQESVQVRILYDASTFIQSAPIVPQVPEMFVSFQNMRKIDAGRLLVGTPVLVRITRTAGVFRATSITVGTNSRGV